MSEELLKQSQAIFMEWIKLVEYEVATAAKQFETVESAGLSGDLRAFGEAIGKAHGHTINALSLIRNATQRGFDEPPAAEKGSQ